MQIELKYRIINLTSIFYLFIKCKINMFIVTNPNPNSITMNCILNILSNSEIDSPINKI